MAVKHCNLGGEKVPVKQDESSLDDEVGAWDWQ